MEGVFGFRPHGLPGLLAIDLCDPGSSFLLEFGEFGLPVGRLHNLLQVRAIRTHTVVTPGFEFPLRLIQLLYGLQDAMPYASLQTHRLPRVELR